jgi:putative tricarboxylic transport membrane protein
MSDGVSPPEGARSLFQIHFHNLVSGGIVAVIGVAIWGYVHFFVPSASILYFMALALVLIGVGVAIGLPLGGTVVAAVGLALLGYAWSVVPNANISWYMAIAPGLMAAALALIGVAVIVSAVPIPGPRDFYGGIALVDLTTLALIASADLPGQRGFAFGPGTAPRLFSFVLAALGAAVAVGGVFAEGPPIEKYKIRGPMLVVISILVFAILVRPFGLITATFLAFIISIIGSTEMRWIESLIGAVTMTIFCWALFVLLLNLPFQLWPRFS